MAGNRKLTKRDVEIARELLKDNRPLKSIADTLETREIYIEAIRDNGDLSRIIKSDYLPTDNPYYRLDKQIQNYNKKGDNLYNIEYTIEDVISKFGLKPKCYLSGIEFDLLEGGYHFDHILPKSCGGKNTLDNMEVMQGTLNIFKCWNSLSDMLWILKKVLEYQGCTVTKPARVRCQDYLDREKPFWREYWKRQEFKDAGSGI